MAVDWRTYGDVSLDTFRAELARVNSPMLPDAEAIWNAAKPHSALALAMMWHEQKYGTWDSVIPKDYKNPLSQTRPGATSNDGVNRWMRFGSYAEAVAFWKDRLTSPTGPYAGTTTLADLIHVYAPSSDGNNESHYVDTVQALMQKWPRTDGVPPPMALNMTKGLIPLPPMQDAIVNVSARNQSDACRGYDWLGTRTIRACVLHRAQSNGSNEGYFDLPCCPALTDMEIHHTTAQMKRFVRLPGNSPSGWANGKYLGAYGDGEAFADRFGVTAVNRDVESCEVCGHFKQPGEPGSWEEAVSPAVWPKLSQWIASRAHDYGIRWDTFPLIPAEGNRSFVIWHQEFTLGTGKVCPGKTVMDATPGIIAGAKAIMKAAQEQTAPPSKPVYVKAKPLDVGEWDGRDRNVGGTVLYALRRRFTCKTSTKVHQYASTTAPELRAPLVPGETIDSDYIFQADGTQWIYTAYGSRVPAGDNLAPRVTVTA